jgi:hypothetical protein
LAGFVGDVGSAFSDVGMFRPAINRLDLAAKKRARILGLWAKTEFDSFLAIISQLESETESFVRLDDENSYLAEKVL